MSSYPRGQAPAMNDDDEGDDDWSSSAEGRRESGTSATAAEAANEDIELAADGQSQQQQQAALWRLPAKQNPDQVYVYASLETPGAFGKDLMNEGLLSQVDYIAHGNEKASSLWLPQMISTKGLMASYEAFSRSKQSRIPGIAWLGKNCQIGRASCRERV